MTEPQRGQLEPVAWQVVPQLEQVDTDPTQVPQPLTGLVPGQVTVWPLNMFVVPFPLETPATVSKAQLERGKRGSEKNSSHTASANSSQGGTSQKP